MMRKTFGTLAGSVVAVMAMAGVASAHAVVYPQQANANTYEKFSLRVPSEKDVPTTKVKVEIPDGFQVSRVQPMAGWTYTLEKTADATAIKSITWTGGKIGATEFQEFAFQGKVAPTAGKYAFRAYQTYENGEIVEWAGASEAKTPASFVEVKESAVKTDDHGNPTGGTTTPPATAPVPAVETKATPTTSPVTTGAAWGGLGLGAVALILSLRRR